MVGQVRESLRSDDGMSLVEVMVALFIFALVSTGFIYTMMSVMSISRDTKVRQVATQLAAEELDVARGVKNVVDLAPASRSVTMNGDTFTVDRIVEWVSDAEATADFKCGASASGAKPRYKRVNVRVTWGGMRDGSKPVQADSIINPRAAVTEEGKAAVLFTVLKSDGTGANGISITATSTAAAGLGISATDSQGCSAALSVQPGTYSFALYKEHYVDDRHNSHPTVSSVNISAGATVALPFQYDKAATYTVTQAPGTVLPKDMHLTFANTRDAIAFPLPASTTSRALHPDAAGYFVMAGDANKCPFVDPRAWQAVGEEAVLQEPIEAHGSVPGGSVTVTMTMPRVEVAGVSRQKLIAVSKNGLGADCLEPLTYTFDSTSEAERTISLPFGAWDIYKSSVKPGNLVKADVVLSPLVPAVTP